MNIYTDSFNYLKNKVETINIIDVGCARGEFLKLIKKHFLNINSIGIDPLNHCNERVTNSDGDYTYYIQGAIDNIENDENNIKKFYVNSDDQASSLLEMNYELLTNNPEEKQNKYYIQWASQLKTVQTIDIKVFSLKTIIEKYSNILPIHYLKIDSEGKDLDVVKSLKKYINNPHFISMECSSHSNPKLKIFKNGCHINEVIAFMQNNNYQIFKQYNYEFIEGNGTQMSDIIFINKSII